MKLSRLKNPAALSTLLGVVVAVLALAVVDQHIGNSTRAAEISRQKQMLAALNRDMASERKLTKSYSKLSRQLGHKYKEVSWGKQMPFMVNQLTGILQLRKLDMETLRPEPVTSANGVSRLPLRISFKAKIGDLAHVVEDIEKSSPLLSIEQLDVRTTRNNSDLLQANLMVSSFAVTDARAPEIKAPPLKSLPAKPAKAGLKSAAAGSKTAGNGSKATGTGSKVSAKVAKPVAEKAGKSSQARRGTS